MQTIRKEVVEQWANAPARDQEGKEWLWQFYKATEKFENVLTSIMETGKMAKLQQERSLMDKVKQWRTM